MIPGIPRRTKPDGTQSQPLHEMLNNFPGTYTETIPVEVAPEEPSVRSNRSPAPSPPPPPARSYRWFDSRLPWAIAGFLTLTIVLGAQEFPKTLEFAICAGLSSFWVIANRAQNPWLAQWAIQLAFAYLLQRALFSGISLFR
jgi:hypothetical protein